MTLLLLLLRAFRTLFVSALCVSSLAGLAAAALVGVVNQALEAPSGAGGRLGAVFGVLSVALLLLNALSQALFAELSQGALAWLRLRVSARVASAPYRDLEHEGAARLLGVLTHDVSDISAFFVQMPRLVTNAIIVAGCLSYLALLSWRVCLLALIMVALGSATHHWGLSRASHYLRRARLQEDTLYEHFRALFAGAKQLKLHSGQRGVFLTEVLASSVEAARAERTRGLRIFVAACSWGAFLFFLVIGGVVFALGSWVELEPALRSGVAVVFLFLIGPVEGLLESIPAIGRTRVAIQRLRATLGLERFTTDGFDAPGARPLPPMATSAAHDAAGLEPSTAAGLRSIQLVDVVHRYRREMDDGAFELGPLSLELRQGEIVYLIGGNGSGKTTLAKLLVGLYEPEAGGVLLNGRAVDARARSTYRQNFSAVFSDFHLFESLLGIDAERLDERARALLRALHLEHKVTLSGDGFSTTELSAGQRKRLALLVAVLEDRPVYVFDEWAADQEPAYKDVFYRELLPGLKARGKAVLVITHDERYFELADRQLWLEDGRLARVEPETIRAGSAQREANPALDGPPRRLESARG